MIQTIRLWRRRRRAALRLLEVGLHWPPETFVQRKLEQLADRGIRVAVAVQEGADRSVLPGVRVVPVLPRAPLRSKRAAAAAGALFLLFLHSPRRAAAVARAATLHTASGRPLGRREAVARLYAYARLALLQPDVVHFEWTTAAVHFHSLGDALGCPTVVSVRGSNVNVHPHTPSGAVTARGLPIALGRAAAVHCVSAAIVAEAARHGLDPAKAKLIRPAVDATFFRPPAVPRSAGGEFRLVASGMLRWLKGYEYVLLAVAALAADGVPVTLEILGGEPHGDLGERSDAERLRYTIADLGLEQRVHLRGAIEPAQVRAALQSADAFLHPSLTEGLPNAVLEAMACGLPVVATDVGGTREAVREGVDGFLVPPRDPAAAAAAIRALWEDPALRVRMGAAARARVDADFTLVRQTDEWVELYEQVARAGVDHASRPPRLVEVGLRWPPETFVQRKLLSLALGGVEIRIVRTSAQDAAALVPGAAREPIPLGPGEIPLRRAAWDAAALCVSAPHRLRRLVAAVRASPGKTAPGLWRQYLRVARLRADVVHVEWLQTAVRLLPALEAGRWPVTLSCHGAQVQVRPYTPRGERERLAEQLPRLFGRAAAVHCVSDAATRAAERHGLDRAKSRLIRPGVDSDFFRPPALSRPSDGVFRVVSVGWLRWVKGYEYALLALAVLVRKRCPASLEILGGEPPADMGEPSERERLRYTIADLGLERRVQLAGFADPASVRAALQRADVFLQPSLSEGLPNTVLEAMACGLPVVATDVGGTREAVRHGTDGFLVPPRDPGAAASSLARLWRDPGLRARMGAAARARVVSDFSLEREATAFRAMYAGVAGRRAA